MSSKKIHIAHSPDSDDAFMFYALAAGKIETEDFEFVHKLEDIETLNRAALQGKYEVTAISIHAYAYIHERYALLNSGASMGEGYGPILVSRARRSLARLGDRSVAVPGEKTSAFLALKLFRPQMKPVILPFDEIVPAVKRGQVEAGVVIHEGQLTYREEGLHKLLDLGQWWRKSTGLPLPLGGSAIRRDLGEKDTGKIARLVRRSIRYALSHREEALQYALHFSRGLDAHQGDRFVSMYVNERTLDYGREGRQAVQLFLDQGHEAGVIPHRVMVEFV